MLSLPAFNSGQDLAGALVIGGGILIGNVVGYEASVWSRAREPSNAVRIVPRVRSNGSTTLVGVAGSF